MTHPHNEQAVVDLLASILDELQDINHNTTKILEELAKERDLRQRAYHAMIDSEKG